VVAPTAGHIRTAARFLAAPGALEAVRVLAPARESRSGILKTANIPAAAFTSQAPLTLAYFGKWSELKGTDLLLDAIARTREPSRFRLWIAGSPSTPDYGSQLRADAQRLLPGEVVTFHGEYDKRELGAHAIATAHLFVTGTRAHESFGLVVDEALELGMGCLLPDLGAMGERAAAVQWATVYESGAADSLAALLDSLADNPARVAALRDGASRAIREGDFSARAPGLSALAEEMQSCLQDAIALGIPKAAAAALDQVDWTAREQRLSQESAAWDEALSKS
jgi:glycosyltransferase involved in cell wall biosynthesis